MHPARRHRFLANPIFRYFEREGRVGLVGRYNLADGFGVTLDTTAFAATGTVTSTLVSTALVGVGTQFLKELAIGDSVYNSSDALIGVIASITDATNAVLAANGAVAVTAGSMKIIKYAPRISSFNDLSGNGNHLAQATASKQMLWINSPGSRPYALSDGQDDLVKGTFTLAQPETLYAGLRQIEWGGILFDGNTSGTLQVYHRTSTPIIAIYAGASAINVGAPPAIGADTVLACVFNGASSSIRADRSAPTTGDLSSATGGAGLTVACSGNGTSSPTKNRIYEMALYSVADPELRQRKTLDVILRRLKIAA